MAKKALITGITGQDGSYLAELLLSKGYQVHGIIRRASTFNTGRLDHIYADPHGNRTSLKLHYGDLSDASALARLVGKVGPDEIYNLAAQSHVRVSFDSPEYTTDITATGATRLLEAIRETGINPRFYQASSSEMYGKVQEVPQRETTPFYPRSPYGCAKLYVEAMWLIVQQEKPDDYVIATNETHSVREFLEHAFGHVGLDWKKYVEIDPTYYRPAEVDLLIGDSSKARKQLGWEPKTKFHELVKLMVDADIQLLEDHLKGRIKVTS